MHINKIKTMYGTKYAVTETNYRYDKKGNKVSYSSAVEYVSTMNNKKIPQVAIFPLTEDGLNKARELRKDLQK